MLQRQYFSFRYFFVNERHFITPLNVFNKTFKNVPSLSYRYVCGDIFNDGRHVGLVEFDSLEVRLADIAAALGQFGFQPLTETQALLLSRNLRNDPHAVLGEDGNIYFAHLQPVQSENTSNGGPKYELVYPLTAPNPPTTAKSDEGILEGIKNVAKHEIDVAAGEVRSKYITHTPGQSEVYAEKASEAIDFVTAGYPTDLSNYPFIQADVDAYGKTAHQAADDILAMRSLWVAKGAQVERLRLMGKNTIDAITITTTLADALDTVDSAKQNTMDSLRVL
jgi:hypothetical protein